jgi:hypothetical protein
MTPPFAAVYASEAPRPTRRAAMLEVLMMAPPPPSCIFGIAYLQPR